MKKGTVVYGFAGVGKSYICSKFKNAFDLEEELFRYLNVETNKIEQGKGVLKKENKNFPNNYFKALEDAIKKYDYVFVSYNAIKYCQDNSIDYLLFFPQINYKETYLCRYYNRQNSENFINNLKENFNAFINKEKKDVYAEKIVFLKKDEFLEDTFKRLGLIKNNKLLPYNNNKLSIIIPIYNSAKYLRTMLTSINNQTYKNIEVVLVNDGSNDESESICQEFIKSNNNFKYFYKQNGGVSSARNLGLKHISGKYVCFLDSDDIIEPNYCETLVNTMENHNADLVMSGIYEHCNNNVNEYGLSNFVCANNHNANFFVEAFNPYWFPVLWNKIYRTSIIKNNNLKFEEKICYDEDTVFNLKYYALSRAICAIPQKLYHYFIRNNNSLTSKGISKVYENSLKTIPYRISIPKKLYGENKQAVYVSAKKILKAVLQELKAKHKNGNSFEEILNDFNQMLNNKYVKKVIKYISVIDNNYCEYRQYYKIFVDKSKIYLKNFLNDA